MRIWVLLLLVACLASFALANKGKDDDKSEKSKSNDVKSNNGKKPTRKSSPPSASADSKLRSKEKKERPSGWRNMPKEQRAALKATWKAARQLKKQTRVENLERIIKLRIEFRGKNKTLPRDCAGLRGEADQRKADLAANNLAINNLKFRATEEANLIETDCTGENFRGIYQSEEALSDEQKTELNELRTALAVENQLLIDTRNNATGWANAWFAEKQVLDDYFALYDEMLAAGTITQFDYDANFADLSGQLVVLTARWNVYIGIIQSEIADLENQIAIIIGESGQICHSNYNILALTFKEIGELECKNDRLNAEINVIENFFLIRRKCIVPAPPPASRR